MARTDKQRFEDRQPARKLRTSAAVTLIGGSSYVAMLMALVRSALIMRMIGPAGRGVQRLAGLYKGYLANLAIGWRHGLSKELPMAVGAGDVRHAAEVEDSACVAVGVVSALAGLGMVLYAIFLSPHGYETRVALAIAGGLLVAEEMTSLYWTILRSWERFGTLALAELVRTFGQFALMVAGAWVLGVTGVMLGWLAAALVLLAFLHYASRIAISLDVRWREITRLLLVGLPVALITFSDVLLRTVDGAVLAHFYGKEDFGLYTLAMQMVTYLFAIPQSAGFVIFPKVLQSYGAGDQHALQRRRVLTPTIVLAAGMPVISGVAWLMLPSLVALVVPDFAPAVPAAQVLSMGAVFLALPMATNAALVANDREPAVIATKLAGSAIVAGVTLYLVMRDASLLSVAYAACAGFAVAAVLSVALQLQELLPRRLEMLREVALSVAPTAWVAGAIWLSHRALAAIGLPIVTLSGGLLGSLALVVISFPCLYYAHRRTGVGHEVWEALRRRFGD